MSSATRNTPPSPSRTAARACDLPPRHRRRRPRNRRCATRPASSRHPRTPTASAAWSAPSPTNVPHHGVALEHFLPGRPLRPTPHGPQRKAGRTSPPSSGPTAPQTRRPSRPRPRRPAFTREVARRLGPHLGAIRLVGRRWMPTRSARCTPTATPTPASSWSATPPTASTPSPAKASTSASATSWPCPTSCSPPFHERGEDPGATRPARHLPAPPPPRQPGHARRNRRARPPVQHRQPPAPHRPRPRHRQPCTDMPKPETRLHARRHGRLRTSRAFCSAL